MDDFEYKKIKKILTIYQTFQTEVNRIRSKYFKLNSGKTKQVDNKKMEEIRKQIEQS